MSLRGMDFLLVYDLLTNKSFQLSEHASLTHSQIMIRSPNAPLFVEVSKYRSHSRD